LYIRFGVAPTIWIWDFANVTINDVSTIQITDSKSGYYFAGVYGFKACSFNLTASLDSSDCPNQCSKRATCISQVCQCPPTFTGDYCETMVAPLNEDAEVTGYVARNSWNYYTHITDTEDNFVIYINQTSGGDCDLYVRGGAIPTRFNYDYQDLSTVAFYSLSISDPGDQTWYIGVYGWAPCDYQIWVDETSSCPGNCNGHGQCTADGTCICTPPYTGDGCDSQAIALSNGVALYNQQASFNNWVYYSFPVVDTSSLHILVLETSTTGFLWLYVAKTVPTLRNYMFVNNSRTELHIITSEFDTDGSDTYQIGVYANPYSEEVTSVPYSIVAFAPDYSVAKKKRDVY